MAMKTIPLSQGYISDIDDEDYERVAQFKWTALVIRNRNGEISIVYGYRNAKGDDGKQHPVMLHRFILGLEDKSLRVDHIDHNGTNNTRSNLRVCTQSQNQGNRRMSRNNRTGYRGVEWYPAYGMWTARVAGKRLGYFRDITAAIDAHRRAASAYFGDFLNLAVEPAVYIPEKNNGERPTE